MLFVQDQLRGSNELSLKMESSATGLTEEEIERQYINSVSLKKFVTAKDVADMAVFLVRFYFKITGQALAVDGHTEKNGLRYLLTLLP